MKIIGNAAAVSETRKPISAMSHPVPVPVRDFRL
jgi:hypothetical protein